LLLKALQPPVTPHAPVVAIGSLPGIAGWGALTSRTSQAWGTLKTFDTNPLIEQFAGVDTCISGWGFCLSKRFGFFCHDLAGINSFIAIERSSPSCLVGL